MTEIDRYKQALANNKVLMVTKFKMHQVLTDEINILKMDILKMQKKLNGR